MSKNPSKFKGDNLPVDEIRWNDAAGIKQKERKRGWMEFTLPTEGTVGVRVSSRN